MLISRVFRVYVSAIFTEIIYSHFFSQAKDLTPNLVTFTLPVSFSKQVEHAASVHSLAFSAYRRGFREGRMLWKRENGLHLLQSSPT